MAKIVIATILDNINTGTFLQALALGVCVRKLGHNPVLVNYSRPHLRFVYLVKNIFRNQSNSFFRKGLSIINISLEQILRMRLKHIVRKVIPMCSLNTLSKIDDRNTIYMTGSDQVWNNEYNRGIDPVFYLDFAPQHAKKIAYAASIGQNSLSDIEKESMRSALKCYACLTVREDLAKAQLTELGYDSTQVLDPTLLLSKEEWLSVFKKSSFIKVEPFLLVYSVEWNNDDLIMKLAKDIASLRGLKIYVYSTSWNVKSVKCDKRFVFGTPDLFISLFSKADYVIVSSFHGTAFSINFNKQFLAVLPDKYSSRSVSILNKFNLSRRMYNGETAIIDIDYTPVNAILSTERNKSMSILAKMVN